MKKILILCLILSLLFAAAAEEVPCLHTEFALERYLIQVPEYEHYVDGEETEYLSRVAFFAEEPLTNFRYISVIAIVSEAGDVRLLEDEVLFTLETFGPDKPLVIDMELPETIPYRAFAFVTADGTTHFCYPALSGENGTPILVPCLIETRDIPE